MAMAWQQAVGIVLVLAASTAWGQSRPVITVQPRPQILPGGQTATFRVVATGEGTLSYQWRKDGVDLANGGRVSWTTAETTSQLTISGVTSGDVGSYDVIVTNAYGTKTSQAARLGLAGYAYAAGNKVEVSSGPEAWILGQP